MKRLLFVIALLLFALPTMAADITFQWDLVAGQTWDNVKLYELAGTNYTLKGTVPGTATTFTLTGVAPGNHTYIVRSLLNTVESIDSNSVSKAIQPGQPGNFRIVMVSVSDDGTVTVKLVDPAEFFRAG
jgi:hypothetical protein